MTRYRTWFILLAMITLALTSVWAVTPAPAEFAEVERWAAAAFEKQTAQAAAPVDAGLFVSANHGVVQQNSRNRDPLMIAGKTYANGLYCHAPSKIIVRLPSPGRSFSAVAGVDARANGGSVIFSVSVGQKEVYSSAIMGYPDAGIPVAVELNGTGEFTLEVSDAGDGISCDQANWAEAQVILTNGCILRLGDMPITDGMAPKYSTEPFFSFFYADRPSGDFLNRWKRNHHTRKIDSTHTEHTLMYTDPDTGLEVRSVGIVGHNFPTVEWTLYFKNAGKVDTPILSEIQALDTCFERRIGPEFVLYHHRGDFCAVNSFEPLQSTLEPKAEKAFAPTGGRPSNGEWPYYNLEWNNGGVLLAIGWPGQWASKFIRDEKLGVRVCAGQELTHFTLHPGEEVRTPLIALLFYKGDWLRGQNLWRAWMFADNFPKPKEGALHPVLAACSGWQFPKLMCNKAGEITFIDRYLAEGVNINYWWMDAGWYPCDEVGWPKVGTWTPDPVRYPGGLRAVSDYAHGKGIQTVVWFEPERVHAGTWLAENHPDWIFGGKDGGLLKIGEPEVRQWLTDHVDRLVTEQGIDLYRQDFNIDPLPFWRGNDSEDRQGITEIRHVEGYLAYWDELRRRHPGMLIDSCASGGRRDDFETMRRAIPLLRTDFEFDTAGNQCCTYGFNLWLPYYECGNRDIERYAFRSNMAPWLSFVWDVREKDLDYDLARRLIPQWREVAAYYFGDFYPLTGYSTADDVWMAWQFNRVDLGAGMVQVFRRARCPYTAARLPLRGLNLDAQYKIRNLDSAESLTMAGAELTDLGMPVEISERPGACIFGYERIP